MVIRPLTLPNWPQGCTTPYLSLSRFAGPPEAWSARGPHRTFSRDGLVHVEEYRRVRRNVLDRHRRGGPSRSPLVRHGGIVTEARRALHGSPTWYLARGTVPTTRTGKPLLASAVLESGGPTVGRLGWEAGQTPDQEYLQEVVPRRLERGHQPMVRCDTTMLAISWPLSH